MSRADYLRLPTFTEDGFVRVVVEAPKGAQAKFKWEPGLRAFAYVRALAEGLVFPHDFGFVPSTYAPDGDPLDAMVLHAAASFPGAVIDCCAVAILEIEQREDVRIRRNDRVLFRPAASASTAGPGVEEKSALEQFFRAAVHGTGKSLRFLGWYDASAALEAVRAAARAFVP